ASEGWGAAVLPRPKSAALAPLGKPRCGPAASSSQPLPGPCAEPPAALVGPKAARSHPAPDRPTPTWRGGKGEGVSLPGSPFVLPPLSEGPAALLFCIGEALIQQERIVLLAQIPV